MADVTQTISGDSADAQRAYADLAKQVVKLEEANVRLARKISEAGIASDKATKSSSFGANSAVREVAGLASTWLTVTAALNSATQAQQEFNRNNAQSGAKQITVGDSQAQIIKNSAGASSADRKKFIADVQQLAKDINFQDLESFNLAAASGLSASGGNMPAVLNALRAAGRITRDKPSELPIITGTLLDIGKFTGNTSAEENLGFVTDFASKARITNLEKAGKALAPAVANFTASTKGDKQAAADQASAMVAAFSSAVGDVEGTTSSQAATKFNAEIQKYFTEGVKVTMPGYPHAVLRKPKNDPGTPEGRLQYLQQNQQDKKMFWDNAELGEVKFRSVIRDFLDSGANYQAYKQNLANQQPRGDMVRQMNSDLKTLTPQQSLSDLAKQAQANTETLENSTTSKGLRAQASQIFTEGLSKTRQYSYGRFGLGYMSESMIENYMGAPGIYGDEEYANAAASYLGERQQALLYKQRSLLGGKVWGDVQRTPDQLSQEERANYDYLGGQKALLETIAQQLKEMNDRQKQVQPQVAPAMQRQREAHQER